MGPTVPRCSVWPHRVERLPARIGFGQPRLDLRSTFPLINMIDGGTNLSQLGDSRVSEGDVPRQRVVAICGCASAMWTTPRKTKEGPPWVGPPLRGLMSA